MQLSVEIIVATANSGKAKEIREIFPEYKILTLKDLDFKGEIEETGRSFKENAFVKARAVYDMFHEAHPNAFVLADDSGLEVDALDGRPGIYSARYAGEKATQQMLIDKLLGELSSVSSERRTARFACSMALITPSRREYSAEGFCKGWIGSEARGDNGFGYDPVFLPADFEKKKTMAELSNKEKNAISHRRRALDGIKSVLDEIRQGKK